MAKERPILMTPENAQKCFNGTKTMTRRVVKPPKCFPEHSHCDPFSMPPAVWWWNGIHTRVGVREQCPYGVVGDRLWVREAYCVTHGDEGTNGLLYRGQCDEYASLNPIWKPSIHMPRWACRTVLEITDIRVERLQEISEEDALAEGVMVRPDAEIAARVAGHPETGARMEFYALWESIHGIGSWSLNPWVWVISFKKVNDAKSATI